MSGSHFRLHFFLALRPKMWALQLCEVNGFMPTARRFMSTPLVPTTSKSLHRSIRSEDVLGGCSHTATPLLSPPIAHPTVIRIAHDCRVQHCMAWGVLFAPSTSRTAPPPRDAWTMTMRTPTCNTGCSARGAVLVVGCPIVFS